MNAKHRRLRYVDYLDHMLDAVKLAQSYVEGLSKDDFLHDRKTQQAVVLNIVVIGEAATQLVDEHRHSRQSIPTYRGEKCAVCAIE